MGELIRPSQFFHPCMSCGACCAYFRVAFYWREANPDDHSPTVPKNYWIEGSYQTRIMSGTQFNHRNRCKALDGKIGSKVSCRIYEARPSPCRQFIASYENGFPNKRCDEARAKYGLDPLTKQSFQKLKSI